MKEKGKLKQHLISRRFISAAAESEFLVYYTASNKWILGFWAIATINGSLQFATAAEGKFGRIALTFTVILCALSLLAEIVRVLLQRAGTISIILSKQLQEKVSGVTIQLMLMAITLYRIFAEPISCFEENAFNIADEGDRFRVCYYSLHPRTQLVMILICLTQFRWFLYAMGFLPFLFVTSSVIFLFFGDILPFGMEGMRAVANIATLWPITAVTLVLLLHKEETARREFLILFRNRRRIERLDEQYQQDKSLFDSLQGHLNRNELSVVGNLNSQKTINVEMCTVVGIHFGDPLVRVSHPPKTFVKMIDNATVELDMARTDHGIDFMYMTGDSYYASLGLRRNVATTAAEHNPLPAIQFGLVVSDAQPVAALGPQIIVSSGEAQGCLRAGSRIAYLASGEAVVNATELVRSVPVGAAAATVETLARCGNHCTFESTEFPFKADPSPEEPRIAILTILYEIVIAKPSKVDERLLIASGADASMASKDGTSTVEKGSAEALLLSETTPVRLEQLGASAENYAILLAAHERSLVVATTRLFYDLRDADYWRYVSKIALESAPLRAATTSVLTLTLLVVTLFEDTTTARGAILYVIDLVIAVAAIFIPKCLPPTSFPIRYYCLLDAVLLVLHILLFVQGGLAMQSSVINTRPLFLLSFAALPQPTTYSAWLAVVLHLVVAPSVLKASKDRGLLSGQELIAAIPFILISLLSAGQEGFLRLGHASTTLSTALSVVTAERAGWAKDLLSRVIPEYIVPVVEAKRVGDWDCISDVLNDVAILHLGFPARTSLASQLHLFDYIEKVVQKYEAVELITWSGDRAVLGGPLAMPVETNVSFWESTKLMRRQHQETVASETAALLLHILYALQRRETQVPITAILHRADGVAAVVGIEQPRFHMLGKVTVTSSALLDAAPDGSWHMTGQFLRLAPQVPGHYVPDFRWRCRGNGYLTVFALDPTWVTTEEASFSITSEPSIQGQSTGTVQASNLSQLSERNSATESSVKTMSLPSTTFHSEM